MRGRLPSAEGCDCAAVCSPVANVTRIMAGSKISLFFMDRLVSAVVLQKVRLPGQVSLGGVRGKWALDFSWRCCQLAVRCLCAHAELFKQAQILLCLRIGGGEQLITVKY